ncbi:DUF602-domain-containing protein [Patellaria atrata CBS 101060]|uniref:DUF602-domain-containing protein n=1 Tax=Patellaria atrata CBS 101060 TaxID=1346257 RepID=A0A9P4SEU7_9PEZI|nr:DUF602-domain-containing protein [Patellaria atrata CBS 101060]
MGNDGGSIPTRRELVKEATRDPTTTELKASQHEQQEYYWSTDPLSNKPLAQPIVSDLLGQLYNKDSVIEFLLPSEEENVVKKTEAERITRGSIRSLRDVVQVKFEVSPDEDVKNGLSTAGKFICPITKKTLGPGSKTVYLVPCGHAFSASVIKEIAGEKCLQCNEPYAPNDIIPILPTDPTDIARLSLRVQTLRERGLTHALKKLPGSRKRKKNGEKSGNETNGESAPQVQKGPKQQALESESSKNVPSGIKNASTASLTAKVLEEQEILNKRRKTDANANLKGLFSSKDPKATSKNTDFMNRGYTIPAQGKR